MASDKMSHGKNLLLSFAIWIPHIIAFIIYLSIAIFTPAGDSSIYWVLGGAAALVLPVFVIIGVMTYLDKRHLASAAKLKAQ